MSSIKKTDLESLDTKELFQLRKKCSDNHDIESLLTIAKYRFIKGSPATNVSNLPEMCYYFGRLNRVEELKEFLSDKSIYLFTLPASSKELAQNLFKIGHKFPHLNETEISYLEDKYCNPKTFELFDIIMFDDKLLPRKIKRIEKESLNKTNTDFSKEFLLKIFDSFLKNEELEGGYEELFIYSKTKNKIIRKEYEDIGLGEYYITQPIKSKDFWTLIKNEYDENSADWFLQKLCFIGEWQDSKEYNYFGINSQNIEKAAQEYFNDSSKVNEIKCHVAKFWLTKINAKKINLN